MMNYIDDMTNIKMIYSFCSKFWKVLKVETQKLLINRTVYTQLLNCKNTI